MILLKLIRFLRGYVWFEARGPFVERFLNLVARAHIPIWEGHKRGEVYTGCVLAKDYRRLRAHAKKAEVRLHVVNKKGAPFKRHQYRGRTGLLAGLVLFAVFLIAMGQFIWRIEITGNERITDTEILQALDQLGVSPGTLRASIDVRDVERRAILLLPELSWFALNIDGSAIHVALTERTQPPAMVDPGDPCNIVASEAGQILSMYVYEGQALVEIGDTVLEGDIIVSGITQDAFGQSLFRHARADVFAQVQTDIRLEVPLAGVQYRETGKSKTRGYLGIFDWHIPLFLPLQIPSPYHVERTVTPLKIFAAELPLTWLREEYVLMEEVPVTYTRQEAEAIALQELELVERTRFGGGEILYREITNEIDGDSLTLHASYICNIDIALEKQIALSQ